MRQCKLGKINSALIGGYEEITPNYYKMLSKIKYWQEKSFAGEGCVSFVFTGEQTENSIAQISKVELLSKGSKVVERALDMQKQAGALMLGLSGDSENDLIYEDFISKYAPNAEVYTFKNLSGEYFTSSAFGIYAATQILKEKKLENILFYNHYRNCDHALVLLEQC